MLKHLKESKCPVCGDSTVVGEEIERDILSKTIRIHTNGQRWETRTFLCGQAINWIPNFSKSELDEYYTCKNNPEYRLKLEKRKVAVARVRSFIDSLNDVDDEYKTHLKNGRGYSC
ncbi:hypothetical protein HUB98_06155 [Paenibacillus barcinonensis]|uniref:Uncharacterized protein n=1 Tax=Paenibacillus barcinonensis TaxID=198119 RepID=A0A2V4VWB1_PAEBA|nr:hypothetical protein [Paenibacillus barcinonensis]PYE51596.1 hypothetical protein DFQ00_102391 [Paenibacillus barcinonensis]QKS55963.1 hypothetical protein HUB98_06155 [Paenibacillus barcinonensis]